MIRRARGGMTLIEVMIAITLLSLLSVGMLFALRTGLAALDASQRRLLANRRATNAQRVLAAQVAGFLPVMARCGASEVQADAPLTPFFLGMPTVMRFVTSYSLQGAWRGEPQIIEIFVITGENGQGVRLVENEIPYRGPVGAGFFCQAPGTPAQMRMPEVRPDSFVLADKLASCRFLYKEEPLVEGVPDLWHPAWDVMTAGWPRAIRIELQPLERQALRVPPMTFTGRIRVTGRPGEKYEF